MDKNPYLEYFRRLVSSIRKLFLSIFSSFFQMSSVRNENNPSEKKSDVFVCDDDLVQFSLEPYLQVGELKEAPEFFEMLKKQIPINVGSMHKALSDNDSHLLKASAHSLKGVVGYFGGEVIRNNLLKLEEIATSGNFDGAQEIVDNVEFQLQVFLERGEKVITDSLSI